MLGTSHGRNHLKRETDLYFLASFAPTSGIGFYEAGGSLHRFNLVTGEDAHLGRCAPSSTKGDQVEAGLRFPRLEELLAFARNAYLRDKKEAYYGALFTRRLNKSLVNTALRFLNDDRLCTLAISRFVVTVLREVADPRLVARIICLAHEAGFANVRACISTELAEIALTEEVLGRISHRALASRNLYPPTSDLLEYALHCREIDGPRSIRGPGALSGGRKLER